MSSRPQIDTRLLLSEWRNGNAEAAEHLMPLVYDELRLLARTYLQREPTGHTLQATALVHEAYLRLVGEGAAPVQTRAHFFSLAARVMRHALVDHARRRGAEKRGGDWDRLEFNEALNVTSERGLDLVALDDALCDLAQLNPQHSQIVELRFFAGLSNEEIAEVLDVSPTTIKREWRIARVWLRRCLLA